MANTALWNKKELKFEAAAHLRHFPTEFVLRSLLSSQYFTQHRKIEPAQRVLDIGCLYANNLVPFGDRGCELFGVEVTDDAVTVARETAEKQGLTAHIEKGVNTALPFTDDFFDIVLSINTIHYEDSREAVMKGLGEMHRVLKPGGCLLISTAGQDHNFVKSAQKEAPNRYIVRKDGDFRAGQHFSFFDSAADFTAALQEIFPGAETAIITESYPRNPLQFYVGKGIRQL